MTKLIFGHTMRNDFDKSAGKDFRRAVDKGSWLVLYGCASELIGRSRNSNKTARQSFPIKFLATNSFDIEDSKILRNPEWGRSYLLLLSKNVLHRQKLLLLRSLLLVAKRCSISEMHTMRGKYAIIYTCFI